MQVFRELHIRGTPDQIRATAEAICESITGDWSRDLESEERIQRKALLPGRGHTYSFHRKRRGQQRAVDLYLMEQDQTVLWVTNIVPQELGQLSYSEFNGVLEEFVELFARPASARTGSRIELSASSQDLEDWVPSDVAQKLRHFSLVANKWSGANHPDDRKLWNDFVLAAHRKDAEFSSSTLSRWLHEVGGWDEQRADQLAGEYEHARGLLAQADSQAVGA